MTVEQGLPARVDHQRYLRPLKVGIAMSMLAEFGIFIVFGVLLSSSGQLIHKFIWTVILCGIGMGTAIAAFITFFVNDCWQGWRAIVATATASVFLLGVLCNLLCLSLDMDLDHFGGRSNPGLFVFSGVLMAALGGVLMGWLLFTDRGARVLDRLRV